MRDGRKNCVCPMDIKKAEALREAWGDKPCEHPSFERETIGASVSGLGYIKSYTNDFVCTQCGRDFTREEKERIEQNSKNSNLI